MRGVCDLTIWDKVSLGQEQAKLGTMVPESIPARSGTVLNPENCLLHPRVKTQAGEKTKVTSLKGRLRPAGSPAAKDFTLTLVCYSFAKAHISWHCSLLE